MGEIKTPLNTTKIRFRPLGVLLAIFFLSAGSLYVCNTRSQAPSEIPVFEITPVQSKIKFDVEASVAIQGTFDSLRALRKASARCAPCYLAEQLTSMLVDFLRLAAEDRRFMGECARHPTTSVGR